MRDFLTQKGLYINKIYYCPNHKNGIVKKYSFHSQFRKPGIAFYHKIKKEWNIRQTSKIYMIGDQITDLYFARNCGIKGLLFKNKRLDVFIKKYIK